MNWQLSVGRPAISGREEKEFHVGRFFCQTVERVTDLAFDRWWKSFEVRMIIQGQNHLRHGSFFPVGPRFLTGS